LFFFFSSRRRHTRFDCDWSSDVCSSDLTARVILKHERCQRGSQSIADDMKRPGKKAATDRNFVVALSRGLEVLRAFRPNDGLLRSEERRVGKEWSAGWATGEYKEKVEKR